MQAIFIQHIDAAGGDHFQLLQVLSKRILQTNLDKCPSKAAEQRPNRPAISDTQQFTFVRPHARRSTTKV